MQQTAFVITEERWQMKHYIKTGENSFMRFQTASYKRAHEPGITQSL